jgi:hypothetical protein
MVGELPTHRSKARVFNAPLGSAKDGRLVLTTEAKGVTLFTDPALQGLVRGHFVHQVSWVGFEEGIVMVGYYPGFCHHPDILCPSSGRQTFPPSNWGSSSDQRWDEITLKTSIPWEIEFRDRILDLNADLSELELRSLDMLGGAERIRLLLPGSAKATFIYIRGGIRHSEIRVPPGVGVRVQVSGGVKNLVFDGQRFAAMDEGIHWENSNFNSAANQCNICIVGGATDLTIERSDDL